MDMLCLEKEKGTPGFEVKSPSLLTTFSPSQLPGDFEYPKWSESHFMSAGDKAGFLGGWISWGVAGGGGPRGKTDPSDFTPNTCRVSGLLQ